jgi:threonine/homoserine/homoserine lactone efflux protein
MDGIWGFLLVSVVLTVSPGPDDVLVLRCALRSGPRLGAATALGAGTGSLAWGAAAACGLARLVADSPPVYDTIRFAGAGYLLALGLAPLMARPPGRHRARGTAGSPTAGRPPQSRRAAFATGLVSDLLNAKIGLFYLAVLPLFVPAGAAVLEYALLLCAIDVAVAVTWLVGLACLAAAAVGWLRRPAVALWSHRALSACLVGLGVAVAAGLP